MAWKENLVNIMACFTFLVAPSHCLNLCWLMINDVLCPGGVLPMWWVIHMCRGFDPLFSLWQDRARSFLGIFLIHQQQSYLLGYKNYQFLQKSIFLAPNSIFSSIFWVQFSAASGTPPSVFRPSTPPGVLCPSTDNNFTGNVSDIDY